MLTLFSKWEVHVLLFHTWYYGRKLSQGLLAAVYHLHLSKQASESISYHSIAILTHYSIDLLSHLDRTCWRKLAFEYVAIYPQIWHVPSTCLFGGATNLSADLHHWRVLEDFGGDFNLQRNPTTYLVWWNVDTVKAMSSHLPISLVTLTTSQTPSVAPFVLQLILPPSSSLSFDMLVPTPPNLKARAICTVKHILNQSPGKQTLKCFTRMQRVILYVCFAHFVRSDLNQATVGRTIRQRQSRGMHRRASHGIMHHSPVWPNKPRQGNMCSCFQNGQKMPDQLCSSRILFEFFFWQLYITILCKHYTQKIRS